jgi:hypothetical protein
MATLSPNPESMATVRARPTADLPCCVNPGGGRLTMLAVDHAKERLDGYHLAIRTGGLTQTQIDRVDFDRLLHGPSKLWRRVLKYVCGWPA